MGYCPICGKMGYRAMGAGDFFCADPACRTSWSEDDEGRVTIK